MAADMKKKLVTGLTSSPKYIPTWYNYDNDGSTLRHKFTTRNTDNTYLTMGHVYVFEHYVQDVTPMVPYDLTLVDLGSGNCSKGKPFIDELLKRQKTLTYYPLDISGEFLMKAVKQMSEEYDDSLVIRPICSDYVKGIEQLGKVEGPKMILWINGIANLSYDDQANTFRLLSAMMSDKCRLVFSADITQDRDTILKAYNDDAGCSRTFIQHAIVRLNKDEGSQIALTSFKYDVDFISDNNPDSMSFVRAYIQATEDITYPIPGLGIDLQMKKGERLYFHEGAGFSCKYTLEQLRNMVEKAGLRLEETWTDDKKHVVFCQCKATL